VLWLHGFRLSLFLAIFDVKDLIVFQQEQQPSLHSTVVQGRIPGPTVGPSGANMQRSGENSTKDDDDDDDDDDDEDDVSLNQTSHSLSEIF
jgi:hypothetical protein